MAEADPMQTTAVNAATVEKPLKSRRKKLLTIIAIGVLLAAVGFGIWYLLIGRNYVSTDNAYVGAESAQITPMVAGQVLSVEVRETQQVKKGQVLVRIDDRDARIALADAEATLAKARRQFGQTAATGEALSAQVAAREADIARSRAQLASAQADYDRARIDYERRQKLAPTGAVSGDELTSATNAFKAAQAALELAKASVLQATSSKHAAGGEYRANEALIKGTNVDDNPEVLSALARVEQAKLDLSRTVIVAPFDGIVAQRTVQVGQRVAPGAAVMTVVPVSNAYVDANFKERQLGRVRIGQDAKVVSDLYGSDVVYHGKVVGLAGGTGSAFALIPAQNATGNWIKVVQRLPVRIALDPEELARHPLRVGLSMDVEIDLSNN